MASAPPSALCNNHMHSDAMCCDNGRVSQAQDPVTRLSNTP
jgi:hypothetical protein